MKQLNERFSEEILQQMMGLYVVNSDLDWLPLVPLKSPLTVDNFGLLEGGVIYTAEDFRWYHEDGSDRDLMYDDTGRYFDGDDLPDEVFCLLNTVICLKFAKQHMADAKERIDATDNDEAKQAMNEAFIKFEKLNDTTESIKKFQTACNALTKASNVFKDIDDFLYNTFSDASNVICVVICDLEYISDKS